MQLSGDKRDSETMNATYLSQCLSPNAITIVHISKSVLASKDTGKAYVCTYFKDEQMKHLEVLSPPKSICFPPASDSSLCLSRVVGCLQPWNSNHLEIVVIVNDKIPGPCNSYCKFTICN